MVMRLFGDAAYVPTFMLGLAAQHGKLPVGSDPIEEAIRLNDVAVEKNLLAFSLGRLAMCDPERFSALAPTEQQPPVSVATTLDGLIAESMANLSAYQDARLASRFDHLVHQVQAAAEDRKTVRTGRRWS